MLQTIINHSVIDEIIQVNKSLCILKFYLTTSQYLIDVVIYLSKRFSNLIFKQ